MEKTCLHRGESYGKCKNCQRDYEPISKTHPINNESCKDYYEIHIQCYNVIEANSIKNGLEKELLEVAG